jgi:hypothetical protein
MCGRDARREILKMSAVLSIEANSWRPELLRSSPSPVLFSVSGDGRRPSMAQQTKLTVGSGITMPTLLLSQYRSGVLTVCAVHRQSVNVT